MPQGSITDPIFNKVGKDYGVLIENCSGHHYLYLKDKTSQFYPHGTPVVFQTFHLNLDLMKYEDEKKIMQKRENGEAPNYVVDLAIITGIDDNCLPENGFVNAIIPCIENAKWDGKTDIDTEEIIKFFLKKEKEEKGKNINPPK